MTGFVLSEALRMHNAIYPENEEVMTEVIEENGKYMLPIIGFA